MRKLLAAGIAALVIAAGSAGYVATTFEKPSFGMVDIGDWEEVSEETIEISSEAWINNPNPVGLSIGFIDLKYSAEANNMTLASGKLKDVKLGTGNNTKTFNTTLNQGKIPDFWVKHLENGEKSQIAVPITVSTPVKSITVEAFSKEIRTDLTDKIEKNLNSIEGQYEGPGIDKSRNGLTVEVRPELEVKEVKASWGNISPQTTETNIDIRIHNPNAYAVPTPAFAGNATLNNVTLAKWDANAEPLTTLAENGMIAPGETENLRFKVGLRNEKMDDWLETHVERKEYTEADINAHMIFEFNEKKYSVPAGGLKCQFNVQTAILVENVTTNFNNQGCEALLNSYPGSDVESSSSDDSLDNYSKDDLENYSSGDEGSLINERLAN